MLEYSVYCIIITDDNWVLALVFCVLFGSWEGPKMDLTCPEEL